MEPIPVRFNSVVNLPVTSTDPSLDSYDTLLSPNAVHVRLSAKCNLECDFCERMSWLRGDKDPEQDMTLEVWEAIRDKIMPFVQGVEVCGLGEPTLHPLFPQIAKEVVTAGKVLYFPTNGLSLGSKKILDAIGDTPRVSVSLDAWDAESYKQIRTGDWGKVIAAIRKFRKAKPNAFLHSQFTAGTYNIDGFPQFLQVLVDEGFNEAIMRFVQTHTVAREDVSLRFAKERTEKAIYAAQLIAEKAGLPLTVERRPYSEFNAESIGDASPVAKLSRYLDFVPMEDPACPSGCVTNTVVPYTVITEGNSPTVFKTTFSSNVTCTDALGTCVTLTNSLNLIFTYTESPADATNVSNSTVWSLNCLNSTCVTVGGTITVTYCTTQTSSYCTTEYVIETGVTNFIGVPTCYTQSLTTHCATVTAGTCPTPVTLSNLTYTKIVISWQCSCACSSGITNGFTPGDTTGTCHVVTSCGTVVGATRTCIGGMENGSGPEIVTTVQAIKSVVQPLGSGFSAMSVDPVDSKPIQGTPAAIIAWADGKLTSCFAMHEVGNVLTNTWDQVIKNPRYQAFLHRRSQMGGTEILDEPWCAGCSRTY